MKYWIHAAKQLINTWRSNIGIFVELILVLGVVYGGLFLCANLQPLPPGGPFD